MAALLSRSSQSFSAKLNGAHVQAIGWVYGQNQLVGPGQFPGQHHLLDIAAGEDADRRLRARLCDDKGLNELPGILADCRLIERHALAVRLAAVILGDEFLGNGNPGNQRLIQPLLRDVADAGFDDLPDGHLVALGIPLRGDGAAGDGPKASLWEMKTMEQPAAAARRIMAKRSWISGGVSTDGGSSRMRILAP